MKKKISFFIDGFNLYHRLKQLPPEVKWLDLRALCSLFIKKDEIIQDIYYFSAFAFWMPSKVKKHKIYIKALKSTGVKPIFGKFKKKEKYCNLCKRKYISHEEKQTDVNIAIQLQKEAFKNNFDTAFILSADSDLIPPIESIQQEFPLKKIGVLCPPFGLAKELKEVADFYIKIKTKNLKASLFPNKIIFGEEELIVPKKWKK